jgi:hypothetical protein
LYATWCTLCCTASAAQEANPDAALTPADVRTAVEALRHDPNLRRDKTIRSLHWVAGKDKPTPPQDAPGWVVSLFRFMSESASLLIWVAGAIGLAVAAVWVFRLVSSRRAAPPPATVLQGVSRIQDLDIDPDSLPADVGAAALSLLEAGRAREALSLLYRGALSRIVHRFAVAVGESFTEGEALRAVERRLDGPRVQYFSSLVALWQRVVYAADAPAAESVAMLCRSFASNFDGAANRGADLR